MCQIWSTSLMLFTFLDGCPWKRTKNHSNVRKRKLKIQKKLAKIYSNWFHVKYVTRYLWMLQFEKNKFCYNFKAGGRGWVQHGCHNKKWHLKFQICERERETCMIFCLFNNLRVLIFAQNMRFSKSSWFFKTFSAFLSERNFREFLWKYSECQISHERSYA